MHTGESGESCVWMDMQEQQKEREKNYSHSHSQKFEGKEYVNSNQTKPSQPTQK